MNNEIKEILNYLDMYKNMDEGLLNSKDKKSLLDYIANLQQENHELKSKLECYENGAYYSSKVDELEQENEKLKQDYINLRNYIKMRNVSTEVEDKALLYNIELENINKKKYLDYKSRCEKAIEYNKEIVDNYLEEDNCEYCDGRYATAKHNLNILQNGSDDNE